MRARPVRGHDEIRLIAGRNRAALGTAVRNLFLFSELTRRGEALQGEEKLRHEGRHLQEDPPHVLEGLLHEVVIEVAGRIHDADIPGRAHLLDIVRDGLGLHEVAENPRKGRA